MTTLILNHDLLDALAERFGSLDEAADALAIAEIAARRRKTRIGCIHTVITSRERDGKTPVTVQIKIRGEKYIESFSNMSFGQLTDAQLAELKRAQQLGVEVELKVDYTETGKIVQTVIVTSRPCKKAKDDSETREVSDGC